MAYNPQNPNGQATMANSSPVVVASDQSTVPVGGNAANAAADSGNPVKVGGVYRTTAPVLSDGQRGDAQLDVNGNVKQTLATMIAGEDLTNNVLKVEQRFSYTNITTQTTTVVKSGPGFLHAIDFTATASGVITIYDNTAGSGTKIRTITSPGTLLQSEVNKILNVNFATGLTIVTSGAAQDIVVSYR